MSTQPKPIWDWTTTRLPAVTLAAGARIVRIHHKDRGAVFFGPSLGARPGNRFDAPAGEFRVLYAAERLEGAFVETILRHPRDRILRPAFVNERAWTSLRLERPLRLAKLFDEGLQAFGVDAGEIGARDYRVSRELARAIYAADAEIDGIGYRSRYNNGEICYALFDRVAAGDLTAAGSDSFDANSPAVTRLMTLHHAIFDTSESVPDEPPL